MFQSATDNGVFMNTLVCNNVTLAYDIKGEGEPILFISGMNRQLTCWADDFIEPFTDHGFQTIRFDNRDVGLSSKTPTPPAKRTKIVLAALARQRLTSTAYDLTDLATDTKELIEQLGHDSVHIVGFSMGAMIAQEIAIRWPEKVRSLALIASHTGSKALRKVDPRVARNLLAEPSRDRSESIANSLEFFRLTEGSLFDEAATLAILEARTERNFNPDATSHHIAAMAFSRDRTKLLHQIKVPTLAIHGLEDPLVAASGGIAVAERIEGARFLAFSQMGHSLTMPFWQDSHKAIIDNARKASSI